MGPARELPHDVAGLRTGTIRPRERDGSLATAAEAPIRSPFPFGGGPALPRLAHSRSTVSVRALAEMIPGAIARAEALSADDVVDHLRMALETAEKPLTVETVG